MAFYPASTANCQAILKLFHHLHYNILDDSYRKKKRIFNNRCRLWVNIRVTSDKWAMRLMTEWLWHRTNHNNTVFFLNQKRTHTQSVRFFYGFRHFDISILPFYLIGPSKNFNGKNNNIRKMKFERKSQCLSWRFCNTSYSSFRVTAQYSKLLVSTKKRHIHKNHNRKSTLMMDDDDKTYTVMLLPPVFV